ALLTVAVTVFIASQKIKLANEQALRKSSEERTLREEVNWKAFQDELDKNSPDKLYNTTSFMPRLRSFITAGNHREEMIEITKSLLSGVSSPSALLAIWSISFSTIGLQEIGRVIEVSRGQKRKLEQLERECQKVRVTGSPLPEDRSWAWMGACSYKHSTADLERSLPDASAVDKVLELKELLKSNYAIQIFLSSRIADYMKLH